MLKGTFNQIQNKSIYLRNHKSIFGKDVCNVYSDIFIYQALGSADIQSVCTIVEEEEKEYNKQKERLQKLIDRTKVITLKIFSMEDNFPILFYFYCHIIS